MAANKDSTKEIKSTLKNAREAIRNKEYKDALKYCKSVLKLDKTNYNALVFIGLSASELGQPEQARMAYRRAIESDESQILAWQGLAALFEKENIEDSKTELEGVYEKLVQLYQNDKGKRQEIITKLVDLFIHHGNIIKATETLQDAVQLSDDEQDKIDLLCRAVDVLQAQENLGQSEIVKLEEILKQLICGDWIHSYKSTLMSYHECYLKLLVNKLVKAGELLDETEEPSSQLTSVAEGVISEAMSMRQLYPDCKYPLEVLCQFHLQNLIDDKVDSNETISLCKELREMDPSSGLGTIGIGYSFLIGQEYIKAQDLLGEGLNSYPKCATGWLFLARVQRQLHSSEESLKSAHKGLNYVSTIHGRNKRMFLKKQFRILIAEVLAEHGNNNLQEAKSIFEELLATDSDNPAILVGLGTVWLLLGDASQATEYCKRALEVNSSFSRALALQGQISFKEGLFDDAELRFLEAIEHGEDVAFYYFLLGKLYWEMNGNLRADKSKCLAQFLKAAKLDPFYSPSFLYLGHYYRDVLKDSSKACRCYQKSFDLKPESEEAGMALGDILVEVGNEDAAVKLYSSITAQSGAGRAKWAWLRLGLVYLKQKQSTEAIGCFQIALRVDPKDRHCWECLGEAYVSRGSYTAALKTFTRASELDPSAIYCLFQIAAIKQLLCMYEEAVKEYKQILSQEPDYIPALKGLGETYLALEKAALAQDFNGRAVDRMKDGLIFLAKAVECKPNLSCLWKTIGDCCAVIHPVADHAIRIVVPESLGKCVSGSHGNVFGKAEVISLASSAYGRALKILPECSSLWNDLGYSYYLQARDFDEDKAVKLCQRAIQAIKKGLNLEPSNHRIWITLGVIAASREISNPELSQHAFIMSLKVEPNNAIAWTNLGVLYLQHGKIEPAHDAFKNAQALDPSYTAAWIGQATIAEMIGSEEAMDLFRHTIELGSHTEGSLGYAQWVCRYLVGKTDTKKEKVANFGNKPTSNLSHLPPEYRRAVLQASTALAKYTDRIGNKAGVYNMFGLLLEHQGLLSQAKKAYERALGLLQHEKDTEYRNIVCVNQARVLCFLGRYQDSIAKYQSVQRLTSFYDVCGLSLAYFRRGMLKESYQAYDQALQLTSDESEQSCVLAALGMLGYALNDKEGAKSMLFKSSQTVLPCQQGLMALCALGLVSEDATLAGAALAELLKLGEANPSLVSDVCFLYSRFYAAQGHQRMGLNYIVKAIHRHPAQSTLRERLAAYIIQACPENMEAAVRSSAAAVKLRQMGGQVNESLHPASLVGTGSFVPGEQQPQQHSASHRTLAALRASQKAVHANPGHVITWSILSAAVAASNISDELMLKVNKYRQNYSVEFARFVSSKVLEEQSHLNSKAQKLLPVLLVAQNSLLEALQSWLVLHTGYCLLYCGMTEQAADHCDKALTFYKDSPVVNTALHVLKAQVAFKQGGAAVEAGLNQLQASVISSPSQSPSAWQIAAQVQSWRGSPMAAELCYRQCLQSGNERSGGWRSLLLLRLALLALQQVQSHSVDSDRWMALCQEASGEALKMNPRSYPALLIQGVSHYLQGNIKSARRLLESIANSSSISSAHARYWLLVTCIKKKDKSGIERVLAKAKLYGDPRQDVMYFRLATNSSLTPIEKKRLLQKSIHLNPSCDDYWVSIKSEEYSKSPQVRTC